MIATGIIAAVTAGMAFLGFCIMRVASDADDAIGEGFARTEPVPPEWVDLAFADVEAAMVVRREGLIGLAETADTAGNRDLLYRQALRVDDAIRVVIEMREMAT